MIPSNELFYSFDKKSPNRSKKWKKGKMAVARTDGEEFPEAHRRLVLQYGILREQLLHQLRQGLELREGIKGTRGRGRGEIFCENFVFFENCHYVYVCL